MIHHTLCTLFSFALPALLLFSHDSFAQPEHAKRFGDYEVFYSVLNSTFIKPDTASRYGITRAKDRALVNIAVRKDSGQGNTSAHAVEISGSSSDLIHSRPLDFREIREGDTIYYIAELTFRDKELRSFTINIKPEPTISAYTLKFSTTLYHDE